MGFISDLKCTRLFSNLIVLWSSIDKYRHTLGIGQVVTSGKIMSSSFLFISNKLNWQCNARMCQIPVYPDVLLPRVQYYALDKHTVYPYIWFPTLKSDFCQIWVFEVSVGVIRFSVLNRETTDKILRDGKHVTVSGLTPLSLFYNWLVSLTRCDNAVSQQFDSC